VPLEESEKMRYVSSVEQIGIEKGIAQGIQQGMQLGRHEGIQEGMQQGMQKGKHQGEEVLLRRLLTRRFGILPEAIETRLAKADINQLEIWGDRVLDAKSLNEVFQEH
jgi:flagellar biosynthesis/type III secretory pathway protein FliH